MSVIENLSAVVESTNVPISIPRYTLGVDIESKGVGVDTYILSIGGVLIDNWTLKVVEVLNLQLDPNDPDQESRTIDKFTLEWWDYYDGTAKTPSSMAKALAFGGSMSFRTAMDVSADFFGRLTRTHGNEMAVPMRGPDFDYVILRDAWRQCGIWRTPLHARTLDSHRTVERVLEALAIPPVSEKERELFLPGGFTPHVAVDDAAMEGYETARMYHILHAIRTIGYKKTLARITAWEHGIPQNALEG